MKIPFKKQGVIFLLPIIIALFSLSGYSQSDDEYNESRITSVDNASQSMIINDSLFKMLIGLDVYIYDGKTRKKRKVNRYALKKGDLVAFTAETRNRQRYLSEITIFR
jgi:hypothetical protein